MFHENPNLRNNSLIKKLSHPVEAFVNQCCFVIFQLLVTKSGLISRMPSFSESLSVTSPLFPILLKIKGTVGSPLQ